MTKNKREYFPALRGRLGDWAFYSVLMTMDQVNSRVNYAKEIHNSEKLSQLIQRVLDDKGRASEIGDYLLNNKDRFFNSLVIAVYDGDPEWHEFHNLRPLSKDIEVEDLSYNSRYSVGYLSFEGTEKLFALDGQHRLAGIRNALLRDEKVAQEELSVIIVAHHTSEAGLKRTRKLFTTLNKTAKQVSKSEIIALDESDPMAIAAREMVEGDSRFNDARVDVLRKQANLPQTDQMHLMTLINLYDVLEILFVKSQKGAKNNDIKRLRPSDEKLDEYFCLAKEYFSLLAKAFPELQEYFDAKDPSTIIQKYRRKNGGNILFRPVGLLIFSEIVAFLMRTLNLTLEDSVEKLALLPKELTEYPYNGVIWNSQIGTMVTRNKTLVRDLLLHNLGYIKTPKRITERYNKILGQDESTELPLSVTASSR